MNPLLKMLDVLAGSDTLSPIQKTIKGVPITIQEDLYIRSLRGKKRKKYIKELKSKHKGKSHV